MPFPNIGHDIIRARTLLKVRRTRQIVQGIV